MQKLKFERPKTAPLRKKTGRRKKEDPPRSHDDGPITEADEDSGPWMELVSRKEDFQEILRLLVDFDERTDRYNRYGEPEMHYLRRALAAARPENLRVYFCDMGAFMYYIVAELHNGGSHLATGWVHEDGIYVERDNHRDRRHPVHEIVCVTDLYRSKHLRRVSVDMEELPGDFALDLMLEERLLMD